MTSTTQTAPLPKTLKEFVERALAETSGLSPEARDEIRLKVSPWYNYYRNHPPWIVDALDFADTEEIRWLQQYFRTVLREYVTGFYQLDHIYFAVQMVYIGYLEAYVKLRQEERVRKEREEKGERLVTLANKKEAAGPLLTSPAETKATEVQDRRVRKDLAKTPTPAHVPILQQQDAEQFGLFG